MKATHQPYAIVVGLDCITGLQTARIFAARGVPVIGLARRRSHWACSTRACERVIVADPESEQSIDALEALGPTLSEKAVIVPCTDLSVINISQHRSRISSWFHVPLPAHETVETLMNKVSFVRYAQQHDIAIPGTYLVESRADAELASAEISYPCIMKPPMRSSAWDAHAPAKVVRIEDRDQLLSLYDRLGGLVSLLIVQQWVDGTDADLYSCNCYFDRDGKPLASFVARKIRQWPPMTGISCLGEEVRNDVVRDETLKLYSRANYHGLGYVEMKRDALTGKHYVIEPNIGRPTGRSAIAEAGGVELLYTMYADLTGKPLPAAREQRYTGVKWIYWRQDLRSALYYWRKRKLTIRGWLKSLRGKKACAVFSWRDPLPFLGDIVAALKKRRGTSNKQANEMPRQEPRAQCRK